MEQITNEVVEESKGGKRLKNNSNRPLVIVGAVLAVLVIAYAGLCAWASSRNTFYPNYRMNGVDVSGLTVTQAQEALESALFSQEISLYDADTNEALTTLTLSDLGYQPEDFSGDAQFWMEDLQRRGFLERGWTYLSFLTGRYPGGSNWPDPDSETFRNTVRLTAGELSQETLDTSYELREDAIRIQKARDGRYASKAALTDALASMPDVSREGYRVPVSFTTQPAHLLTAQDIQNALSGEMRSAVYDVATGAIIPEQLGAEFDVAAAQAALDKARPGETVTLPAKAQLPEMTAETLKTLLFRDVLGECTTPVTGSAGRISNVKLSAAAFNGLVMADGGVLSYNETTGQRTAAKGYKPAPAYVKGETVDEIGGGVCQTSSTLYLACLRSNLEIVERYAHRYVPAYIPWGMDATVSWGGPDYKFCNNTGFPIRIVTSYADGYLTIKILGTNLDGTSVKMTNQTLSTTPWKTIYEDDPTLAPGTEKVKTTPYTGYKVKSFRTVYDADGKVLSSGLEADSNYKVRDKVILRGPAKAAPVPPTVPTENPADIPAVTPEQPPADETGGLPPEEEPVIIVVPEEPV